MSTDRAGWEDLSRLDPFWAILSDSDRQYGRWDATDFLRTGREDVAIVLRTGARYGVPASPVNPLDFGCGADRFTRALADHFASVVGLDISVGMLEAARRRHGDVGACRFERHLGDDLSVFDDETFDLVLSRLVLQHVPVGAARERYIEELMRVLKAGGLLAFQVATRVPIRHRLQPRPRIYAALRRIGVSSDVLYRLRMRLHPMRMGDVPTSTVKECLERAGGRVLESQEHRAAGGVISAEWYATR
jgi:ubiquinone/menaquinone biosynthesis C-methylase UbiE